jgi:hypothetical protein
VVSIEDHGHGVAAEFWPPNKVLYATTPTAIAAAGPADVDFRPAYMPRM